MGKKHKATKNIFQNNTCRASRRIFHYTVGWNRISSILLTKSILLESQVYIGQKTAAWFSSAPQWENTVKKGHCLGLKQHAETYGAFRIEMKRSALRLYDWKSFIRTSGESLSVLHGMTVAGRQFGANPSDWYYSYEDVPVTKETVIGIGYFHDGKWEDLPLNEFITKYKTELGNLSIEPIVPEMVNEMIKSGYRTTPAFNSVLKKLSENKMTEKIGFFCVGKIIHCMTEKEIMDSGRAVELQYDNSASA